MDSAVGFVVQIWRGRVMGLVSTSCVHRLWKWFGGEFTSMAGGALTKTGKGCDDASGWGC